MGVGVFDLAVVGGGINGAGIARDAAGRGLRVLLCEQDDLAAHTSSASTKLIHGGLRYLEHGEFALVRKALAERERLLGAAPHIMRPLRFVMPLVPGMRPAWMIRAGLFLYDHLAPRARLPGCAAIDLRRHEAGAALRPEYRRAFAFSDMWTDDARLVVLNVVDAAERGATVLTRTRCAAARRERDWWRLELHGRDGTVRVEQARALANATGPWAARFLRKELAAANPPALRLVKGSHIVVPRLFRHECAYLLQNPDRRVVFAIPFEQDFTLIGTTEQEFDGDPARAVIDSGEIAYLCTTVSRFFRAPVRPADVLWHYTGVRPLLGEPGSAAEVTRDYRLAWDDAGPPLLSVLGGKLTTYRKLAEEAVDHLMPRLARRAAAWTAGSPLPGGEIPGQDLAAWRESLARSRPWLRADLCDRWACAYGSRVERLLEGALGADDLGAELAPGLCERELAYLAEVEFPRSAADVLWRRTKLGLRLPPSAGEAVDDWLRRNYPSRSSDGLTERDEN
jgi:glycerol-3-phosphate dehydrogenase